MVRGAGVRQLFKGGNRFKYFSQMEAINNRGTAIIPGNTVL